MKPTVVADEMFPEGAGPYMDIEEVRRTLISFLIVYYFWNKTAKPKLYPFKNILQGCNRTLRISIDITSLVRMYVVKQLVS